MTTQDILEELLWGEHDDERKAIEEAKALLEKREQEADKAARINEHNVIGRIFKQRKTDEEKISDFIAYSIAKKRTLNGRPKDPTK